MSSTSKVHWAPSVHLVRHSPSSCVRYWASGMVIANSPALRFAQSDNFVADGCFALNTLVELAEPRRRYRRRSNQSDRLPLRFDGTGR